MHKRFVLSVLVLSFHVGLLAQMQVSNILEYQYGKVPGLDDGEYFSSHFNQFNIRYKYKDFSVSGAVDHFLSPYEDRNYFKLTQFQANYKNKGWDIKLGHFYEIFGRGLLLRAYEIPQGVLEDITHRVRYRFYKDILGANVKWSNTYFEIKALHGKPLLNQLNPTFEEADRREFVLDAIEGKYKLKGQSVMLAYVRQANGSDIKNYVSTGFEGVIRSDFSYYAEFAFRPGQGHSLVQPGNVSEQALYLALSYSRAKFGLSLEYKDYRNFNLGNGYNDPPAVVREHSWKIPGRSAHVPLLLNERGGQAEVFYSFTPEKTFVLNYTYAKNDIGIAYTFNEYFMEYATNMGDYSNARLYGDYSSDDFNAETGRFAGGVLYEQFFKNSWGIASEFEYQYINRKLIEKGTVRNLLAGLTVSKGSKIAVTVLYEYSTDPFLTEDGQENENWLGVTGDYSFNWKHRISLFAGQRRGGPACTSGICYEVLDFEGIELRWISKF